MLRSNDLTLQQAVDQIKSTEQTQQQVKEMTRGTTLVQALKKSGKSGRAEGEKSLDFLPENHLLRNVRTVVCPIDASAPRMEKPVSIVEE